MLGMAELYVARPDPNIYNFINTQLLSNAFNNVDDTWLFGMWWGGPVRFRLPFPASTVSPSVCRSTANVFDTPSQWNITTAGPKTQINAICLISAAATVNADYLSSAGQKTAVKSVTEQIAVPESTATGAAGNTDRNQNTVANRASQSRVGLVALVAALAGALGLLYH